MDYAYEHDSWSAETEGKLSTSAARDVLWHWNRKYRFGQVKKAKSAEKHCNDGEIETDEEM